MRLAFQALALALGVASCLPAVAAPTLDIGLDWRNTPITGTVVPAANDTAPTVVLLGGLRGDDASSITVRAAVAAYRKGVASQRLFRLIAIPIANPTAAQLHFPPTGVAYRDNPEANVLWRWIGIHAPDLVLIAGEDSAALAEALSGHVVADVGRIPAQVVPSVAARADGTRDAGAGRLLQAVPRELAPSEAHAELSRRQARTPQQLAEQLAQFYGRDFDSPWYINAIALLGQLRLGHLQEVRRLAEPYVNGTRNSLDRPSALVMAGHIVFTDLARRTGDARYVQMVRKVADLGFEPDGRLKESMPYHEGYSDSVFMGTVIAAQAGALTGERRYFDLAARHVAFMQQLVLRPDGLYRHSPATQAAWGRGNAFPAMGLAMSLTEFPKDHPGYRQLLRSYRQLMAVLPRFQDQDGLWRNVIDYPGSYAEYSATAMIGFAMLRGVRQGWLPRSRYQPVIDKAWQAIVLRTSATGGLFDVCESTTRFKSTEEYLLRAALMGPDPRGGAMALLFATEMADLP